MTDVVEKAIDKILAAGLCVHEHKNNSDSSKKVNHLSILGGVRRVEYYPTTETVYANARGEFKKVARGKGIEQAIKIAKEGKL